MKPVGGPVIASELTGAGATVNGTEVPVIEPCVAVRAVLWASYKVTEAVPTPLVKVTDAGYSGAVTTGPGLEDGPEKPIAWVPA